jgi:glycosyltransferase involved in cell wall biosynthesis
MTDNTKPLTIMHVLAGAEDGGAEMAYVDMCLAMHERACAPIENKTTQPQKIIAVCRPNKKRNTILTEHGITVYELPFGGIFDFKTTKEIAAIIEAEKPDIVQSWMSRATAKLPHKNKLKHKPAYIARLGGYYNIKKYYKHVDIFVGATPDLKKHIEQSGIEEHRVFQINNFAETESDITAINRSSLNTPANAFVFLTLARLHQAKAIDTLLYAFRALPEHVHLWIAGEGPDRQALEALSKKLELTERVHFLGWRTDRGALLDACNAVVFPSRYEPFGSTFIQAWAAQRPLVTTASQGPKQYVRHGEDALMTDIDNIEALSNAMMRIIEDKELSQSLVVNGLKRYQNEFTKEVSVNAYLALYTKVLREQ